MKLTPFDRKQLLKTNKNRMSSVLPDGTRKFFYITRTSDSFFTHLCKHHRANAPDPNCIECRWTEAAKPIKRKRKGEKRPTISVSYQIQGKHFDRLQRRLHR